MSKIVFFSIPAYGHTNPTIEVVRELTARGHEVWYYSFNVFQEKIEDAGATFISCDDYLPELKPEDEGKVGKDFSALIEMVVDTTLSLEQKVIGELTAFNPDCIVSDSICFWGKLFALKLKITYICSTTTFAFNQYTARMMKQSFSEIIYMILGMKRVNKKIELLRKHGYEVKNFISIVQNDNDTNTIVYTSKEFQPMVETFSDNYAFIGPSISNVLIEDKERKRKKIYISLGTVNNRNSAFYKNCIQAFKTADVDVVMSVGESTVIADLGEIPAHFEVKKQVEQIRVLQDCDVFITHCGMNSVNESLYYGVPMVLFPQQSEQRMVAQRVATLGAGVMLKHHDSKSIFKAVQEVLIHQEYKEKAEQLAMSFKESGGAKKGVDFILRAIHH